MSGEQVIVFVEDSELVIGQWCSNERKSERGKFAFGLNEGSWSVAWSVTMVEETSCGFEDAEVASLAADLGRAAAVADMSNRT